MTTGAALFLLVLALAYAVLFSWAFRALPHDAWQFLASVPRRKNAQGVWTGVNLTYYGVFTASAVTVAVAVAIVLMGSLSLPLISIGGVIGSLLVLTVPAARTIARLVEGKANTFTIGGAAFVGVLAAPWVVLGINSAVGSETSANVPMLGILAVLAIAYALGEGTGRLACISFGCCYGKPVHDGLAWGGTIFHLCHFVFTGETKKAVYEGGLEAVPVVPIQAMTALMLIATGLSGMVLFLNGSVLSAFLVTHALAQLWRVLSERFRADFRGGGTFSAYQVMALVAVAYGIVVAVASLPSPVLRPQIALGLAALWNPAVILSLQVLWVGIFLYTGRSTVTASRISFHLLKDRI